MQSSQSTEEWISHYNYRDMEIQLRDNQLQSEHLTNSMNLFKAIQWLSVACINVVAWKCIDDTVTILIEPTELKYDPIICGCNILEK